MDELKGSRVMHELVLSPENAKSFMTRSGRSVMGEIRQMKRGVAMGKISQMGQDVRTDETIWAEFLEFEALMDNAPSEREKEAIRLSYRKKHGITGDPDDDRVMMAGVLPDADTLLRLEEEMFGPTVKPKYSSVVKIDRENNQASAISFIAQPERNALKVVTLGSNIPGGGTEMMREAVQASMAAGYEGKLTLVSVKDFDTLSFYYDKIGMEELKDGVMHELVLSPEKAKSFMARSGRL